MTREEQARTATRLIKRMGQAWSVGDKIYSAKPMYYGRAELEVMIAALRAYRDKLKEDGDVLQTGEK